jgi:hypothetical protein
LLHLNDYDCKVDEKAFDDALGEVVAQLEPLSPPKASGSTETESSCSQSLALFLTRCVTACHIALDKQKQFPERQKRWYNDLEFFVGNRAAGGIDGAASFEPDIAGAKVLPKVEVEGEGIHWNPPADRPHHVIVLPVEVKEDWRDMVSQAAAYVRSSLFASPMRIFALALAFKHDSNQLRLLVFHRGGLAASLPYDITKANEMKEVARLFLTLTSWSAPAEAGIIPCCNETTYLLPADEEGNSRFSATVESMLFQSLCVRGKMTRVSLLRLSTNADLRPLAEEPPKPSIESAGEIHGERSSMGDQEVI